MSFKDLFVSKNTYQYLGFAVTGKSATTLNQ